MFLLNVSFILRLTRVNSTNVLDEGLRIGEIGRRMNSKVRFSQNRCISKVNLGVEPGLLSICPTPLKDHIEPHVWFW
jgi:hypothetical protein